MPVEHDVHDWLLAPEQLKQAEEHAIHTLPLRYIEAEQLFVQVFPLNKKPLAHAEQLLELPVHMEQLKRQLEHTVFVRLVHC